MYVILVLQVCEELEEAKRRHAQDTAQGDDVTVALEKEREKLQQDVKLSCHVNYFIVSDCACISLRFVEAVETGLLSYPYGLYGTPFSNLKPFCAIDSLGIVAHLYFTSKGHYY